jgi:hypothetical protein
MKYKYNLAILLGLIILILLVPSFGLVAAQKSDGGTHWMTWEPLNAAGAPQVFNATWEGKLLRSEGNVQIWQIELFPYPGMMTAGAVTGSGMMTMMAWVEMTLMWNPLTQTGHATDIIHNGHNLYFTGWEGTIWFNPVYHIQFSGHGVGTFNDSGTLYPCDIWGSFNGTLYPDDPSNPMALGFANFTEYAILRWGTTTIGSVGGEVIPVDNMAVLSPYLALFALVAALSITTVFVAKRRSLY